MSFNCQLISELLNSSQVNTLLKYVSALPMTPDSMVPKSIGRHGQYRDFETYKLLYTFLPLVEQITGLKMWPTYAYVRKYQNGSTLLKHIDGVGCEYSISLTLQEEYPWPLWIELSEPTSFHVKPGDALLYNTALPHWREGEFKGNSQFHVYFNYVNQNGPRAHCMFNTHRFPESKLKYMTPQEVLEHYTKKYLGTD